jgi:DNA-directed RNA polymerase specialized sigma24 family protein
MSPLGLPLATCAAVITACAGTAICDGAVDAATIQSIDNYCSVSWRRANIPRQDWDDCTQHAFVRLLTRVSQEELAEVIANVRSKHRRELNRCIWATTQWWRRSHRQRLLSGDDIADHDGIPQVLGVTLADVQEVMQSGAVGLTATQRSVIDLWACGYSITDMALKLGVPSRRICDEKYRAISKLRAGFKTC